MKKRQALSTASSRLVLPASHINSMLFNDIRSMINATRQQVAHAVDTGLVVLYWNVGRRIHQDLMRNKRAAYGERILPTLSTKLVPDYGEGFGERNLSRMVQFAERFPDSKTVATLSRQMGWSHFVEIIPFEDDLKCNFYAEMCRIENWSVRTLRAKIGGMLFERTALSRKPAQLAALELKKLRKEDQLSPDLVFRDPYFLDFLGLKGAFQEKDLEAAILREMESFILELGVGFSFVARQKRMQIGSNDYYLDLLFYHRRLKRLIAIELKLEKFQAAHKGQMELYLRWLEKYEQEPGERAPLGLILCAGKSDEEVELLQLGKSGIRVAQYLTELPSRRVLERKLHDSIRLARERLARLSESKDQ
jgi:predicted nuclease of restriction endonuclease-like (RecB) superfamily